MTFRSRRKPAFTLVELLTVISIIVILIGMLFLGINYMNRTAKIHATGAMLENLRSMMAETAQAEVVQNPDWLKNLPIARITAADPAANPTVRPADPNGNWQACVLRTTQVMAEMLKMSANREAFSKLPTQKLLPVPWQAPNVGYQAKDRVIDSGKYYVCIQDHSSQAGAVPSPTGDVNWQPDPTATAVILDGWDNPIIYVPPPGTDAEGKPTGGLVVKRGGLVVAINGPNGQPFWASAGPDGDFGQGDDNIYSFEK